MLVFEESTQPVSRKLKILVYGGPGVGKTMFALGAPSPLVLDTESSTDAYRGRADLPAFTVAKSASPKEIAPVLADLAKRGFVQAGPKRIEPQTVVIDSFSVLWQVRQEAGQKMAEARVSDEKKESARVAFGDWVLIKRPIQQLYTALINLPTHVIITAREKELYDDDAKQPKKIGQGPDLEKNAPYVFDLVLRLTVDERGQRTGIVEKSRFLDFPPGKHIDNPTWETFAGLTMQGEVDSLIPDVDAAASKEAEPEPAAWTRDVVTMSKAEKWLDENGLTDKDVNAALACDDWRKTSMSRDEFKVRVHHYIESKTGGPALGDDAR